MSTPKPVRPNPDVGIRDAGADERASAELLFRRHGEWLRSQIARRFGPDVADDVVQDTWARLITRGRLDEVARPRSFLFRVAENLLIDRSRRSATRPRCVSLDALPSAPATVDGQVETVLLKQVLLDMPRPLRDVFLLSRFGGWTYQSIAEHLNISVKTVEWRMSKALTYCGERLRD